MKLYCQECGAITDGSERAEQIDGFFRPYMTCSYCGSDNVVEAERCYICGQYVEKTVMMICDDCREKIVNKLFEVMSEIEFENPDAERPDIVDGMSTAFEDFYDKYRFTD